MVFDSFGKRFREVDYDTAGTQIAKTNAAAIDELFGYTGRDWDEDVGLQYNRARWYDPGTGRWLSQEPIGFAAGDANLYRYVGNEATRLFDPTGLRQVGSYPVKGKGHHVIPVELWLEFGFDPETYTMLDSYRLIDADTHNFLGHGSKTGYTGFLRAELRERLAACLKDNPDKKLAVIEQQAFIKQFIDDVHAGKVERKYIVDFNTAAKDGTASVKEWLKGNRKYYPAQADEVAAIAIKGLRAVPTSRITKLLTFLGDSVEFAGRKYAPLVGLLATYHQARADGHCPAAAATLASLEEVNPTPVGYDEIKAAGEKYKNAVEWAIENNVHGGRAGRIPVDKDGFPIFRK